MIISPNRRSLPFDFHDNSAALATRTIAAYDSIQPILGRSRSERLKDLRFITYSQLWINGSHFLFPSNTHEFLRLPFYLSGRSEAASAKAQLGAFREKPIYQVVCCIPGVLSGAHRLSFLIRFGASGGSYLYRSEDRLLHSIYTPKFSVVVLVWQYLLHLETSRQQLYYPRSRESNRIHLTPFGCKRLTLTNCSIPISAAMTTCTCLTHARRFVLYEVTHLLSHITHMRTCQIIRLLPIYSLAFSIFFTICDHIRFFFFSRILPRIRPS